MMEEREDGSLGVMLIIADGAFGWDASALPLLTYFGALHMALVGCVVYVHDCDGLPID